MPGPEVPSTSPAPPAAAAPPAVSIANAAPVQCSLVHEVLRGMSLRERLIVCLRYAEGLSLEETAVVLEAGTSEIEHVLEQAIARVRAVVGRTVSPA